MKIISFNIVGKFAHFRKYYSNSTALSFSLPPRTTIIGLLAAVLGLPRDSYYTAFSQENVKIAVGIITPIKKTIHRVNNLKIENLAFHEFMGSKNTHIQTPFEVITPFDLQSEKLIYKVFVAIKNPETELKLIDVISSGRQCFNLSLGAAQFIANIEDVNVFVDQEIDKKEVRDCEISFNTAVISSSISSILVEKHENSYSNFIEEDLLPIGIMGNKKGRKLNELSQVLYTINGRNLSVVFTGIYYSLHNSERCYNIQFLEKRVE